MTMIELYETGRDETWGKGIYGKGQIHAFHDKVAENSYDETVRFLSADYIDGYRDEWNRLTQLEKQQTQPLPH